MSVDWTLLLTALASGALGSFFATASARQTDRRARRGEALDAVAAVSRLIGPSVARGGAYRAVDTAELEVLLSRIRSAAVVVGLPRRVVDQYELASRAVAYQINEASNRSTEIYYYWASMQDIIAAHAWHPLLSRLTKYRSLREEQAKIEEDERLRPYISEVLWQAKPPHHKQPFTAEEPPAADQA